MIPAISQLAEKLAALTDFEIRLVLDFNETRRRDCQEICDIEVEGERLRFDVDGLNAHMDARPDEFLVGAFELDDETLHHVLTERHIEFHRAASLRYAPNTIDLLSSPTTMVEHGGENMLIDGANRVAVLAVMEMPCARARIAPENVWRQFLLPTEGPGIRPFRG